MSGLYPYSGLAIENYHNLITNKAIMNGYLLHFIMLSYFRHKLGNSILVHVIPPDHEFMMKSYDEITITVNCCFYFDY